MKRQHIHADVLLTITGLGLAVVAGAPVPVASGGSLSPPAGPVAPTMKTLAEIEPRTAINAMNTPGDADSTFKISMRGSYYLSGNVLGELGKHGIEVEAGDVTIDMMGFTLIGVPGSLDGIFSSDFYPHNIAITNGAIRDWGEDGLDLSTFGSLGAVVDGIRASNNGDNGIRVGQAGLVNRCTAVDNANNGILTARGSMVNGSSASENGNNGISVGQGCTVVHCEAYGNEVRGITVSDSGTSTVISHSIAANNSGVGFYALNGNVAISNCIAHLNASDGILVGSDSFIRDNLCDANGYDVGSGAGIYIVGGGNRIEANNITDNDRGIDVDVAGNLIIRNSASGNGVNFDIVAGNIVGPTVTAATIAGNNNPHANYDY